MNVPLLKRIAKELKAHPEVFNQAQFGRTTSENACGTVCCIAGMAVLISNPLLYLATITESSSDAGIIPTHGRMTGVVPTEAQKLLGLTARQADALFSSSDYWPEPFATDYDNARTDAERARVGARRIAYFIRTGGK